MLERPARVPQLVYVMSALPPKADIFRGSADVRFVPIADIGFDCGLPGILAALPSVFERCRRMLFDVCPACSAR